MGVSGPDFGHVQDFPSFTQVPKVWIICQWSRGLPTIRFCIRALGLMVVACEAVPYAQDTGPFLGSSDSLFEACWEWEGFCCGFPYCIVCQCPIFWRKPITHSSKTKILCPVMYSKKRILEVSQKFYFSTYYHWYHPLVTSHFPLLTTSLSFLKWTCEDRNMEAANSDLSWKIQLPECHADLIGFSTMSLAKNK